MMKTSLKLLLASLGIALTACTPKDKEAVPQPVAFDKHDRCHICGMVILNYPGAKAEVFIIGEEQPLKFCSVKDGFTFVLQPENAKRTVVFYVTDFGNTADVPLQNKMLEAKKAFYDVGSDVRGAMGKSILPFSSKEAVEKFAKEHGGEIMEYSQIDFSVIKSLKGNH